MLPVLVGTPSAHGGSQRQEERGSCGFRSQYAISDHRPVAANCWYKHVIELLYFECTAIVVFTWTSDGHHNRGLSRLSHNPRYDSPPVSSLPPALSLSPSLL
eukprot:SAG25_NODE_329_length_9697_cov_22.376120_2_plen_102_part_00